MTWRQREREVVGEIMRTDVFVQVFSEIRSEALMEADIDRALDMFRDFESRLSRFREGNELSVLNHSTVCRVSDELFEILLLCQRYYKETNGIFDPTILPVLEQEGYQSSFGTVNFGKSGDVHDAKQYTFADIQIDTFSQTISKPLDCRIDLGGIGKGYIVDCVARMLSEYYQNFLVDAGGDMYAAGRNHSGSIPYFAIEIENDFEEGVNTGLLLVSNQAVATSGVNRRRWQSGGREKSHLIDVGKSESVAGDVLTVTVVASSGVDADIMAKTLCILGRERGLAFAQKRKLPAFFLLKDGTIQSNEFLKPFLWENHTREAAY